MIKAFTGPKPIKPEEILLSEIAWERAPAQQHIWLSTEKHVLIKDNTFYRASDQFFCSTQTWFNYTHGGGYGVDGSQENLFLALYKVLTKKYYE